jgi:hypothetical protein
MSMKASQVQSGNKELQPVTLLTIMSSLNDTNSQAGTSTDHTQTSSHTRNTPKGAPAATQ